MIFPAPQAQALHSMACLYERPLGLGKEALRLEKAACRIYALLLGDEHHLTVRQPPAAAAHSNGKRPTASCAAASCARAPATPRGASARQGAVAGPCDYTILYKV